MLGRCYDGPADDGGDGQADLPTPTSRLQAEEYRRLREAGGSKDVGTGPGESSVQPPTGDGDETTISTEESSEAGGAGGDDAGESGPKLP